MKYTIEGFQQEVLVQYGLDSVDAIILRYIIDFFNTGKMNHKIIDNCIYFWVLYDSIINDLPILRIQSKIVIARRFDKYIKCDLLKKHVIKGIDTYLCNGKELTRNGTFTYFTIDSVIYETLVGFNFKVKPLEGGLYFKVKPGYTLKLNPVKPKSITKDSSTTDYFIKNNSITDIIKNLIDNGKGKINAVFEDDPESYINFDGSLLEIKYRYSEIAFKQKINQSLDRYGMWGKVKVRYL